MSRRVPPWMRRAGRIVERALAIVGVFFIVYHLGFELSSVTTSSMSPLLDGSDKGTPDWTLTERFTSSWTPAKRFQLVSFTTEEGLLVAKRAIAFPGETVQIVSHSVVVDGTKYETPEGVGRGKGYLAAGPHVYNEKKYVVPPDGIFVLGDDQQDSLDSRFTGAISLKQVRGRVILRIWPLSRFKWLL